ncbi:hypothetical protein DQ353_01965 [Arthrobacter sp. AQ5-05]|uniref:hypothetical protein n=1 Tax=Arthrobacter sp. AQ5-05 TaxID=2184581 RepID=UPI000DCDC325|nr:hypothetical protein [Arthrobacter sp. AQ5-05]RAX51166.1 hypothetical protein DQ353_01965 [Arthrobacter sp. AQ5-05]
MTPIRIRSPRPGDAAVLAELHLATWAETYAWVFPESAWGKEAHTGRIRMWSSICTAPRPGDSFAVAERDGSLVGLAGAGAGQGLLDAVPGKDPASPWVLEPNARAVAFYASNGFVPDGTRKPGGYEGAGDEIRMVH